jgi:hypothetical protein
MRIPVIIVLMLSLSIASYGQNRKQLIEFLVHKNDSLFEITQNQAKKIEEHSKKLNDALKNNEQLIVQADSLNKARLRLQEELTKREKAIQELSQLKASIVDQTDSIADNKRELNEAMLFMDKELQQLRQSFDSLRKESAQKDQMLSITPPVVEIRGKFTKVSQDQCFHLFFQDENGVTFDFGSAPNAFPFDVFVKDETNNPVIAEKLRDKTVTLIIALLNSKTCSGSDQPAKYELMPTIIDVRL